MKKVSLLILVSLFLVNISLSHSGRTDKYGGHRDRRTGGYHYHLKYDHPIDFKINNVDYKANKLV